MTASSEESRRLVVAARDDVADGVAVLTLEDPTGEPLPKWTPGAHIDLELPAGTRQYSLCGDPADRSALRVGVLREDAGRGGSAHIHAEVLKGSEIEVRGPRNHFELEPAERYVFIAGGIGITPILPMIAAAEAEGASWTLLYGGRSRRTMAFVSRLEAYGDRVQIRPEDEFGLLDLDTALAEPTDDELVYCCGPEPLLEAVEARCADRPGGGLRVERFTAKPLDEGVGVDDQPIEVVLDLSGLTIEVPPGTSILAAAAAAGVEVMCSCEEGICGTCETDVLEGVPDHRDSVLSQEAREMGDVMMICVSRAKTPQLILDL